VEALVECFRRVRNDALHVGLVRLDEVHRRNVVNGLAILVDEEVEGYAVLAEVLDVDQGGENVLAELIVDEDLVHFLVGRAGGGVERLVEVEHARDAF